MKTILGLCACLMLAGGVYGATGCTSTGPAVCLTVSGVLGPVISGTDPLGLNGDDFTATMAIPATGFTVPPGATTFTYSIPLVTVSAGAPGTPPLTLTCGSTSNPAQGVITLNDAAHMGDDTFTLNNCAPIAGSTFTATAVLPKGTLVAPLLLPFSGTLIQGTTSQPTGSTATYNLTGLGGATVGISGTASATCLNCSTMTASPSTLTFSGMASGAPPPSQSVSVTTAGGGAVNYTTIVTTTSGGNWLSVSPVGGLTGTSFSVTANPAMLAPGTYTGNIAVYATASNSPRNVSVTFNVMSSTFTLNPSPSSFTFASVNGSVPASGTLSVTTTPSMMVPFTATASSTGNWLSVSPTSGTTGTTMLNVSANPTGLSPGTYSGMITLNATGAAMAVVVPVTFKVSTLTATPTSLTFNYTTGGTVPPAQNLMVNGTGPSVMYTATPMTNSGGSWLAVSPGTGSTNSTQSVSVNPTSLQQGTYTGNVVITPAGGAAFMVPVTLNVTSLPTLQVTPPSLTFNMQALGSLPSPQNLSLTLSTGGSGTFTASATSTGNWLSVTPTSGSIPGTVSVSILANSLVAGSYTGSVTISAPNTSNNSVTVMVTLNVSPAPNLMTSVSSLSFAYTIGSTAPPPESFMVTSSGSALNFTAAASTTSGGNWLSVSPTSGTTPQTLMASVNITGLTQGTYNGSITITSSMAANSPVTVPVTLTVSTLPLLKATPSSYTFNYTVGGTLPTAQSMAVSSSTGTALSFTATPGASWVGVNPTSGTTPATLSVSANPAGLTPNTYNSNITLASSGAAMSLPVPVTLTVTPAAMLTVTPASLTFAYTTGGTVPASQSLSVSLGSANVSFTAAAATTSGGNWLSVMPTSGMTPATVTASVNVTGLANGTYNGSVTLSSPFTTNPVVIPVTLTVMAPAMLTVSPSSITFSYAGGTLPAAVPVTVSTNGPTASFTATPSATWLSVTPASGTASMASPATLMVSLNQSGLPALAPGSYSGTITVAAAGFPSQTIMVSLTVTKPSATILVTGNRSFSLTNSSPPVTSSLMISLSDGSAKAFTVAVTTSGTWLSVSPTTGTTPGSVTLTVNPTGLVPGTYVGNLAVTVPGTATNTLNVPITLTVTGANLTATPSMLTFTYQPGTPIPPAQSVMINPVGATTVSIAKVYTNVQWLSVSQISSAPGTIQVTLAPGLLGPGTYEGEVFVQAQGSPAPNLAIAVSATINALPATTVTPTSLTFVYSTTGPAPMAASLSVTSGGVPLNFSVGLPPAFLTVSPLRGTTPGTIMVTPNVAGLGAGTYTGSISISVYGATGSPVLVPVTLTVSGPATLTVSPATLSFTAPVGGATPAAQMLSVSSTGGALSFATASTAPWLSVTPTSGTTPAMLSVTANPTGLGNGTYTGAINIAPAGVSPSSGGTGVISVAVTFVVGTGVSTPTVTNVTNAASYAENTVSPGMIVAIFGSGLGPQTGVPASLPPSGMPFATTLGGTSVSFDGIPAPLLYASATQVNAVVPFEVGSSGATTSSMIVSFNGMSSTATTVNVVAASPGLFTANASGMGEGAIINVADGSTNSASNPAAAGSYISLYGTGGGLTVPPSTDGDINSGTGMLALPVTATVGGQPATVQYAGPAPGFIAGAVQFNVLIPAGTPSGPANVVITVGTAMSQTVTVAVQ